MSNEDRGHLLSFMAALYRTPGTRFSHLGTFGGGLWDRIENPGDDSLEAVLQRVVDSAPEVASRSPEAFELARSTDLARILATHRALLPGDVPLTAAGVEESLRRTADAAEHLLRQAGVDGTAPEVFVVEQMPPPYDSSPIAALSVDEADFSEHGIPVGVYFTRGGLRPLYSDFLYLHELFHVILGRSSPEFVAHGLEEGLADLLGSLWLSSEILGEETTRHLFILNRLSSSFDPYWERYLDYARSALRLAIERGLPWVIEQVVAGRSRLMEIEEGLATGSHPPAVSDFATSPFGRMACDLLLSYPRSYAVSPEAFLWASSCESGLSVVEVGALARVDATLARRAAEELHDEFELVFLRRDGLTVLDGSAARLFGRTILRYGGPRE